MNDQPFFNQDIARVSRAIAPGWYPLRALCGLLALCCTGAYGADTAYVIDKLLVGVHQEQNLDSAIIKVLPTGTRLEVIERKGELALVKDDDGDSGWVDVAYLMDGPPARSKVEQLEKENQALSERLKTITARAATPTENAGETGGHADVEALTKENTELKGKLSAERVKVGELQSEVAALRAAATVATPGNDLRIADLEQSNQELKRQLESAQQEIKALNRKSASDGGAATLALLVRDIPKLVYGVGGALLVLAFGAGLYLMDYYNRRRHGGFRV